MVYQHVQDMPVPPSRTAGSVPPELDGLVMRSLAKDPDDRFQSAEEMRGLVQYSLQMLQVQGGHTGTWNTGPVNAHDAGHTAAMGMGGGTAAMGYPTHGDTSQGPILPPMNPDDGAYAGGHHNGGGRGKMWLFVLLALIAIGAGVAFALNAADDSGKKKSPTSPSTSVSPSSTPSSAEPTDEETEETEEPDSSSGGQTWETKEPTWTPTNEPTEPTEKPTVTPTSPDPGTSDGGSTTTDGGTGDDGGAADGGTDDGGTGDDAGTTTEGTTAGTPAGTAAGAAAGTAGTTTGE